MHTLEKKIIVPYSAAQMFVLITDINHYPNFLSWCPKAELHQSSETHQLASLYMAYGPMRQHFTTRNTLFAPNELLMELVDGPFDHLTGRWHLQDIGNEHSSGCVVVFSLQYVFKNNMLERLIGPVFTHINATLMGAFLQEAKQRYDHPSH